MLGKTGSKGIDEDIAVIALVEVHFATNGRHAEGIAIAADARHDARYQMAGLRMIRFAKAERIHRRDGTRAHGEHVAQNAANAGRCTLIGLDVGRMVVAFHLEDDAIAIADVHHACVFARALNNARSGCRKRAKPFLGGLVGAMLVPHRRENPELCEGGLASDQIKNALILVRLKTMRFDQFRRDVSRIGNSHGNGEPRRRLRRPTPCA